METSRKVPLIYLAAGLGWIMTSDLLVMHLRSQTEEVDYLQGVKGCLFILVTAGLLHVLLRRELRHREKVQKELRDSQVRLESVIESIPQAVFWKDRDSVFQGGNTVFAQYAGLRDPQALPGKRDIDLRVLSPGQREKYLAQDQALVSGEETEHRGTEEVTTADGKPVWIEARKVPLRDSAGEVIGVVGVFEDVTSNYLQAKEIERQASLLREQARTLTERVAELESFQEAAVGREMRIIELKKEINRLLRELGREPVYDLSFTRPHPDPA